MNTLSKSAAPFSNQTDTTKLVSLLALATGAVAMPQTGHADIIYTNMNSNPVTVGYAGVDSFLFSLPGTAMFGFQRMSHTESTTYFGVDTITYRTVLAGDLSGPVIAGIRGNINGFAVPLPAGATWSQGAVATFYNVAVGLATNAGRNPLSGYDHQYLAWVFADSTQGDATRFGWVEISLSINNVTFPAGGSGPNVTIWGYAYDNGGAKPSMGETTVPEPSSGALMVVGALMLGARGLRQWRQNREAVSNS